MAVQFAAAPPEADSAAHNILSQLSSDNMTSILGTTATAADLQFPHEVYSLGLSDAATGNGLAAARCVGWRYLTGVNQSGGLEVEVRRAEDGSVDPAAQLAVSPFNAAMQTAVSAAGNDARVQAVDYTCRLLRVPALYVVAAWLKNQQTDGDDLLVSMVTAAGFTESQIYAAADFNSMLAQAAESTTILDPPYDPTLLDEGASVA